MLFNSWEFLALLSATLLLYYLPLRGGRRKVWQVTLLLAASAVFYAWEEPRLLLLLGASCLANAVAVERILFWKAERALTGTEAGPGDPACRWLAGAVIVNLGFLAFFKYAGFLASQVPSGWVPAGVTAWLSDIPLPVGISFYTFQGISLLVDAWRGQISDHTRQQLSARGSRRHGSIRDTSFYISFFPQLVAGPIVKAHEFVDQIGAKAWQGIDWITVRRGLVTGYFLKIFVADNLAEQTAYLSAAGTSLADGSPIDMVCLLYGYSLQIFADFAGYSLIAIGLGALFGYKLPPNFNFPYLSCSITEFWRRWHLSLSSWLRDYLYIPLGGNRKGSGRTYFNLFLVMFLGGLWHGAAWKFALWGSLHGIFLGWERLCGARRRVTPEASYKIQHSTFNTPIIILKWLLTFHVVTLLWLTFMMPDMASILAFFRGLLGVIDGRLGFSGPPAFSLLFYGSAVVLYHGWGWLRERHCGLAQRLSRSPLEPLIHGLLIFLVLTNPGAPRGFIYFQF